MSPVHILYVCFTHIVHHIQTRTVCSGQLLLTWVRTDVFGCSVTVSESGASRMEHLKHISLKVTISMPNKTKKFSLRYNDSIHLSIMFVSKDIHSLYNRCYRLVTSLGLHQMHVSSKEAKDLIIRCTVSVLESKFQLFNFS